MKRSLSDYAIYFITLMLAVCLFYVFNSITAQQIMLDLSEAQKEQMVYLDNLMVLASIVVSIIFCILCLFANQFLVKRRKKEFGLYMSLGMGKFGVSRILVMETALIGLISLIIGIGTGVLLSQCMSYISAKLFDTLIISHTFVFSTEAALKTIILFFLLFLLVMIFNVFTVNRYTLIDLLHASQKNQKQRMNNPIVNGILTNVSIVFLLLGYLNLLNYNIYNGMRGALISGTFILIGTVLFYLSGINFILYLLQRNRSFYFKKINVFNIRQLKAKINSATTSIILISFMLFFTISILANGMSYKKTIENELALVAPYDSTISIFHYNPQNETDMDSILQKIDLDIAHQDYHITNVYDSGIDLNSLLVPYAEGMIKSELDDGYLQLATAISYSDYKSLQQLQGQTPIELDKNETLIITNMNGAMQTIENMTNSKREFTIGESQLTLCQEKYQLTAIETENVGRTLACFVIPDDVTQKLELKKSLINIQYTKITSELDDLYNNRFQYMLENDILNNPYVYAQGVTKTAVTEQALGSTINILYVGIYVGIVFLIASGAILGLRLLSDASDEQDKYYVVQRIGATEQMITHSVFVQVFTYFVIPLIVAIPNSIVVGMVITKQLSSTSTSFTMMPALLTSALLILLYGGYFTITYYGYLKIVKKRGDL